MARKKSRTALAPRRRVGPSPALAAARNQAMALKRSLSVARRKGREAGGVKLSQVGSIALGGALNGVVQSVAGERLPFNPSVPLGAAMVAASYFGLVKGPMGNYIALAGAGMLAAGASDIVEVVMDGYVLDMLGMGSAPLQAV